MLQSPSISIIIPAYNRENLVASTIESVLKQTYKPLEIIVVDDGSTDNTLDVLKQYGDDIKIIQKENGGSASARNTGIQHASGDYIAYVDSDDTWDADKLSIFVKNLAQCKDPDNVFMFSDFRRYDINKAEYLPLSQTEIYPNIFNSFHEITDSLYVCEGIELLKCLLEPYPMYPSTFLLSRNIHDNFLWNDNSIFCEDFELVLRVATITPFYYVNKTLSTMGMHDSNVTWQTSKKMHGDIDAIKCFSRTIDNILVIKMCNGEIGRRYWAFGHYYRRKYKYISALSCYIKGMIYIENMKRLSKVLFAKIT